MDKKISKTQMLRDTMYVMFKDDHLPYLDMEDFLIMWQSLADQWNIRIEDDQWEEFIEEVNSVASNRQNVFNEIFDKYFI
jgi:ABC-type multidrug transport system ATPase subunit